MSNHAFGNGFTTETRSSRRSTEYERQDGTGSTRRLRPCRSPGFTSVRLRALRVSVVILCVIVLASAQALAATIYMKDGRKIEGEIVDRTETTIKVKLASGKFETVKRADVRTIDEPLPPPPKIESNETGDATVDRRTKDYERWLDMPLATAITELTIVRGDHPVADLKRMAEAAEKTARHFLATFGCQPVDAVVGDRYGPGRIEIFQFWKEDGYLACCDKVLKRVRDETVDDARLAFMRRQRGFWIVSPRSMMSQYQGPSDLATSISGACHKVSHVMLTTWKPSGTFTPWWFFEGFASWQEFAILGETRTYCLDLARPADYSRSATGDADEEAKAKTQEGWRAKVKELCRSRNEKDLARLGKMSLNEIVLVDVQQSWSVVDWLHRTARLRDFAAALKETRDLDAACRSTLGLPSAAAHDAWRAWVARTY